MRLQPIPNEYDPKINTIEQECGFSPFHDELIIKYGFDKFED